MTVVATNEWKSLRLRLSVMVGSKVPFFVNAGHKGLRLAGNDKIRKEIVATMMQWRQGSQRRIHSICTAREVVRFHLFPI